MQSWNLDEVFGNAAKFMPTIVHGVEGFASGIIRGVSAMVDKGEPAVEGLSSGFAELGDAVGDAFESIADGAEGGGEALRDTLTLVGNLVRAFGDVVEGAEKAYSYIHDHPIESSLLSGGLALPIVLLDQLSDKSQVVSGDLTDLGRAGSAAGGDVADAWEGADAAMKGYEDTLHGLVDVQLGLLNAQIGWEQSLDDLNDSLKENGKNWDTSTQKGRDNTKALEDAYVAALEYRDAQVANGTQTGVANRQLEAQIAFLEGIALKAGMTKQQFDAMTGALKNYLALDANKTIRTTHVITYEYVSKEGRIGNGSDPRTRPGSAYASGGPVAETGWALVGEHGPEIRWLTKGDYIWDAQKTARAMASGMGPSTTGGGQISATLAVVGAGSPLGGLIQHMVDTGQLQLFVNGQPVTAR